MNTSKSEFNEIYEAFQARILRFMTRMVAEAEAEDLTQEVFIKISRTLNTFRGAASLSTWVFRIATNTAWDRLRSPSFRRREDFFISEGPIKEDDRVVLLKEEKPPIEKQLIQDEMYECIRGYIAKLPVDYRIVLVLSEYETLKNSEIAEILGVTLDTVKIRLHRAKEKLKRELEEHCEFYWIDELPCRVK